MDARYDQIAESYGTDLGVDPPSGRSPAGVQRGSSALGWPNMMGWSAARIVSSSVEFLALRCVIIRQLIERWTRRSSPAARSSQSVAVVITGGFRCSGWEEDPVTKPVREPLLVDLACRYREHCFNGVVGVGLLVVP